jgi:hypothetical protein
MITNPFDGGLAIDSLELVDCVLMRVIRKPNVYSFERFRDSSPS